MKKTVRIIALLLAALMLTVLIGACSNGSTLAGTWYEIDANDEKTGSKMVLARNGEGYLDSESSNFTWKSEGKKLYITISVCGEAQTYEYTYKLSSFGNKLTLTDSDGTVKFYTKDK